ncbi:hypothetical protein I5L22_21400 [Serratia marcescens]|nr:hypothetical protein [Serratia marcescens]MBH2789109.1 hypothetical protein [Serratia marcescens]HBH6869700.1 hypothetical protein [Serratia marcescens]HEJ6925742.1 hypothetical protein [Serratia marcescens]HEJ7864838.1 hypothetical protein [Serratia marcescens]
MNTTGYWPNWKMIRKRQWLRSATPPVLMTRSTARFLRTYSEMTLEVALDQASILIRAVALRLHAQSRLGHDEQQFHNNNLRALDPHGVVMQEVMQALVERASNFHLSTEGDPILEAIGLYGPDFSGLDQRLINSPAARIKLGKEIAARKQAKAEEEE